MNQTQPAKKTEGKPADAVKTADAKPATVQPLAAIATLTPTAPAKEKPAPREGIDNLSIMDAVKKLTPTKPADDATEKTATRAAAYLKYADTAAAEKTLFDALSTDAKTFDKLVTIARQIVEMTAPVEKTVAPLPGESAEPFHGTPAVVLYNVLHSVGTFAHRLDDFRDKLRGIDRANSTHYAQTFERQFAVMLALKMNVDTSFLSTLRESDLSITRF